MPSPREEDRCQDRCEVEVVHPEAVAAARARVPGDACVARALEIAGLCSNATRFRVLAALAGEEKGVPARLCVCDLALVVGATETATSHQLRALRLAGLVAQERDGRLVYYRMASDPVIRGVVRALIQGGG